MRMKLYRGLKAAEYIEFDSAQFQHYKNDWEELLCERAQGNISFTEELAPVVKRLRQSERLTRQYFTDNEMIAKQYTKSVAGILIQIDVPVSDILKYFTLEFQNYNKRQERLEIVYLVDSLTLSKKKKEWSLQIVTQLP